MDRKTIMLIVASIITLLLDLIFGVMGVYGVMHGLDADSATVVAITGVIAMLASGYYLVSTFDPERPNK